MPYVNCGLEFEFEVGEVWKCLVGCRGAVDEEVLGATETGRRDNRTTLLASLAIFVRKGSNWLVARASPRKGRAICDLEDAGPPVDGRRRDARDS